MIESIETAQAETPPLGTVADAPPATPARPRPQPRPDVKPEPARPEPANAQPAPQEPQRSQPATTLQTSTPEREAAQEKVIRDLLARADRNLSRVDYRRLNADARVQYDQAKRFAAQSEEALDAKNLPFAHNLADKAATLSAQLAGR